MAGVGTFGGLGDIVLYLGVVDAGFSNKLTAAKLQSEQFARNIENVMNKAIIAGGAAFGSATIAAANFQKEMSLVDTLLIDANRNVQELSQEVLDYAQTSSQSIETITKSLYDTISSGVAASDAMKVVALSAKAAGAGFTSIEVASRAGIATMNAYGLATSELANIFDLQFAAVKYGVLTYEQLANSIGQILPVSASLGASLEDVYGSLSFLTKMGQSADQAATNLSRAFQSLVEQQDKLAKFDISIWDKQTGKFLGMDAVIAQLAKTMEGMTDQQRMAALEAMQFDIRAGRAINSMVLNYKDYSKTLKDVANSHGVLDDAYSRMVDNIERQAKIFKNIVQVAFIDTGQELIPLLTSILKLFNEHPEVIKIFTKVLSESAIAIGAVAAAVKVVIIAKKQWQAINLAMAGSFGPIALAITGVVAAVTLLKAVIDKDKKAQKEYFNNIANGVLRISELESKYKELKNATVDIEGAHQKTIEAQKKLNEAIASGSGDVAKLQQAYNEARQAEIDAITLKSKIQETTLKLNEAYKQQGIDIKNVGDKYGELSEAQKKLELDKLIAALSALQKEYEEVSTKETELVTIKGKSHYIAKEVAYDEKERAKDLAKIAEKMENVRENIEKLKQPSADLSESFKKVSDMAENSTENINKKISALTKLGYESGISADMSNKLEKEIKRLNDKLTSSNDLTINAVIAQEKLTKAGIETTDSYQNQIKELNKLIPLVQNDSLAKAQLKAKQDELNASMAETYKRAGDTGNWFKYYQLTEEGSKKLHENIQITSNLRISLDQYSAKLSDIIPVQKTFNEQINESINTFEPYINHLAHSIVRYNSFGSSSKTAADSILGFVENIKNAQNPTQVFAFGLQSLGNMIHEIAGKSDKTGQAIGVLVDTLATALSSGFNPIQIGITAVTGLMGLFGGETQKVNRTLEEVIALVKQAGIDIEGLNSTIDKLSFDSPIIGQLKGSIDQILESMRTAVGGSFNLLQSQLASLVSQMKELTQPFEMKIEIQGAVENTKKLIDEINATAKYLDSGALSSYNKLLENQLSVLLGLISNVKAGSPAYQELKQAIDNIINTMNAFNNTGAQTTDYLARKKELILQEITANEMYINQLEQQLLLENLEAEERATLENELQRAKQTQAELTEKLKQYNSVATDSNMIGQQMKTTNEQLNYSLPPLIKNIQNVADEAIPLKNNIDAANNTLQNTNNILTDMAINWGQTLDIMFGNYKAFESNAKTIWQALQDISYYKIDLNTTTADEQISSLITKMYMFLQVLDPTSQAYADSSIELKKLIDAFVKMGGILPPYIQNFKSVADIQREQAEAARLAKEELQKLAANMRDVGEDAQKLAASQQQVNNISVLQKNILQGLADQLRQNKDDVTKLGSAQQESAIALNQNIIMLKSYRNELISVETILKALREKKLMLKIEFQSKKEDLEKQIAEQHNFISELTQEKITKNIEFNLQITKAKTNIEELKKILVLEDPEEFGFYQVSQMLEDITGKSQMLTLTWEKMLDTMFQEYDDFEKEIDAAKKAIDKMLYFSVDLDTTNMDERINATIFKLRDYLSTLNPDSQAYKDAQGALNELIQKFTDMGGVLDEQRAVEFNKTQVQQAVTDVQKTIEDLIKEKDVYNVKVDADIANAKQNIITLQKDLDDLIMDFQSKNLAIDVDISKAIAQIKQLQDSINALQGTTINFTGSGAKVIIDVQQILHEGGYVGGYKAHLGGDIPAILQRGEYVIKRDTVAKFDRRQWDELNITGNPSALTGSLNGNTQNAIVVNSNFDVIVHSADPNAWAEIIKKEIVPGVNRINRKFVVESNPYNI